MAQEPKTGHKCKLYRNTGTVATPVWTIVDEIGDVSIPDLTRGLAELKRRANEYTKNLASLFQSISIEFNFIHGLDSTTFTALRTAFFAGTVAEYAVMDGDISVSGNEGLRIPCLVENFPWNQPLEEVNQHDIRLSIGYMTESSTEVDPSWLVIA